LKRSSANSTPPTRQAAGQQKVAGQQVSEVSAEPRRGQVIDLMAAFKASLEKRGLAAPTADEAKEKPPLAAVRGAAGSARAHVRPAVERRRAGSKK
jgi:hypothetical protein